MTAEEAREVALNGVEAAAVYYTSGFNASRIRDGARPHLDDLILAVQAEMPCSENWPRDDWDEESCFNVIQMFAPVPIPKEGRGEICPSCAARAKMKVAA